MYPRANEPSGANNASETLLLDARDVESVIVPGREFILSAEYQRVGPDLVLTSDDGETVLIRDFFTVETPLELLSGEGVRVTAELAAKLAGAWAPGQLAQLGQLAQAAPIGRVESVSGEATATRADGTRVELEIDSPIFTNDVIATQAGGRLGIVFADKTTFGMGENARMVVDELIYDPGSGAMSSITSLLRGAFVIVTGEIAKINPDAVKFNTPAAQIGIRGTGFTAYIDAAAESLFNLIQGAITITTTVSTVILDTPGMATTASDINSPPSATFEISALQFSQLFGDAHAVSQLLDRFSVDSGANDQRFGEIPATRPSPRPSRTPTPRTRATARPTATANPRLRPMPMPRPRPRPKPKLRPKPNP